MALQFYLDSQFTKPVTLASPMRFLVPAAGGTKHMSLWVHDSDPGTTVKYLGNENLQIFPVGADVQSGRVLVGLKRPDQSSYAFPGLAAVYAFNQITVAGSPTVWQVDLEITIPAGIDAELTGWALQTSNLFATTNAGLVTVPGGSIMVAPSAAGYVARRDASLPLHLRLLPSNREVKPNTPGFIIGDYRWRDENTRNAVALIPTRWDIDPASVGLEKFIAGIGHDDDLEPIDLESDADSIFLRIQRGHYFTGAYGYYLPAGQRLEFLRSGSGALTQTLQATPRQQTPIFVGTYHLDAQGFYERDTVYSYAGKITEQNGDSRTDLPERYFQIDRKTDVLTLNTPMEQQTLYLGLISGQPIDYFDLPIYPVDGVVEVFIDHGVGNPRVYSTNFVFDREQGTLQIKAPSGAGVSIPGALSGESVYAVVDPAVAVLYETGSDDTRQLTEVDVNPAFSGLAGGFLYLQHRRQKPNSLVLSCDKPRIDIPASISSIIGLVAYGPVFFEGDYALLICTAYGKIPGEVIPNAKLQVVVDNTFTGLLNYQDPLNETVEVVTGGDGTANLIFIPKAGFGAYVPTVSAFGSLAGRATTHIANDTLVLPTAIPIEQIHNAQEGWLATTYFVRNNNPLFGMVGADPTLGEIVFATQGTVGTSAYKTNGMREPWRLSSGGLDLIRPIEALDANGVNYTGGGFLGTVKKLVFSTAVPLDGTVGAYFVSFIQRVTIKMQLENSDIFSNSILLEMAVPDVIIEDPWLYVDGKVTLPPVYSGPTLITPGTSTNGLVNQFRLGYVRSTNRGV